MSPCPYPATITITPRAPPKIIIIIIIITHINSYGTLTYTYGTLTYLISARRPDLIIINKKKRTCKVVDFAVPADHRIKLKKLEKKDKYLDFAWELKKLWNMQVIIIPIVIGAFGTITKWLLKGLGSWWTSGDHPNNWITENSQNTEKNPGDLRRLAVTQTPVKDHQLMLIWKTLMSK